MKEELISIIVPAYNAGPYLENCLDSILKQTYETYEVILIDDGSTDNTGIIADQYQTRFPNRIHVIHTENQGVTNARFEGIRASKGEWIGFVDADDEIEQDMYERLYLNAVQYKADISHCGHVTIVNGGERVHEFYNTGRLAVQNKDEGVRDLLEGVFEPSLWTKLYRNKLLNELISENKIDPSICYYEDLLMNYYLFNLGTSSVFEDFCGYHYLARNGSVTRKGFQEKKVLDPVIVYKNILDDAPQKYKSIVWSDYLAYCMRAYISLYKRQGYVEKREELKGILKKNREKWKMLRKNDRIKLRLFFFSPALYIRLYYIYEKHFQIKKYE